MRTSFSLKYRLTVPLEIELIKIIGPVPSTAPGATGATQTITVPAFISVNGNGQAVGDPILMRDPIVAAFRKPNVRRSTDACTGGQGAKQPGSSGPVHWITRRHDDTDRISLDLLCSARSFTPDRTASSPRIAAVPEITLMTCFRN